MRFEHYERLQGVIAQAAVVGAALDMHLLDALAQAPLSVEGLAERCGAEPPATALMMQVLSELGVVVEAPGGRFSLALSPALLRKTQRMWSGLAARARGGTPALRVDAADAGAFYAEVTEILSDASQASAGWLAERLGDAGLDVVDIGAGASPWGLALASRHDLHVTAVDLPQVLEVTRRAAVAAGVTDRFTVCAVDVLAAPLPRRAYDLALVAHVLHLFGEGDARRVLANVHTALRARGRVAVITHLDRTPVSATYRLGLLLRTRHGRVYPFSAYASWLREAGFQGISRCDVPGPWPRVLITATR